MLSLNDRVSMNVKVMCCSIIKNLKYSKGCTRANIKINIKLMIMINMIELKTNIANIFFFFFYFPACTPVSPLRVGGQEGHIRGLERSLG